MTDENNDLVIKGDNGDHVTLNSAEWASNPQDDGTYTTYVGATDPTVTIKIEDDVSVTLS
jgi:hypothetical protein